MSIPHGYRPGKAFSYEIQAGRDLALPEAVRFHVLAPDADRVAIIRDGTAECVDAKRDGEYLVFEAGIQGEFVLMKKTPVLWILLAVGIACLVVLFAMKKKGIEFGKKAEE